MHVASIDGVGLICANIEQEDSCEMLELGSTKSLKLYYKSEHEQDNVITHYMYKFSSKPTKTVP